MSESLTAQIQGTVTAALSSPGLLSVVANINQNFLNSSLVSGAGAANKVNQAYVAQTTLAASGSTTFVINALGGITDAVGYTYNINTVKLLLIQMLGNLGCSYVVSATAGAGGGSSMTPYQVGDQFSLTSTGSGSGVQALFQVTGISGYGVSSVMLVSSGGYIGGSYTTAPTATGVATTAGSISGATGATLVLNIGTVTSSNQVFTESDYLTIGGAASNAWTNAFTGNVKLKSGTSNMPGVFLLTDGGSTGFIVAAGSNEQLKVTNSGANPVTFLLVLLGATS